MSARKDFLAKNKKTGKFYDERLVTREQKDFTKGVFNDLAVTPKNGLLYLKNAIPMTDGVVSRTGTTLFYNGSGLLLNTGMTAVKNSTTILVTNTNGYTFSASDIGRYFRGSDGIWDAITAVSVVSGTILTVSRSSSYVSYAGCALRGEVFCQEWCSQIRKWIIQIDNRLFLTTWNFGTVTRVYFVGASAQIISESQTRVGFRYGEPVLFNSNGMYSINTSKPLPYYYKMNSKGPQKRTADITETLSRVFGRRYLCTFSILSAIGQVSDIGGNATEITRLTKNIKIEHESSPNITQNTPTYAETNGVVDTPPVLVGNQLIDYTEMYSQFPIGVQAPGLTGNTLTLYAPPDPHWLYHSVWATQDVGKNGIVLNYNSERYFFVKDIPVTKALTVQSDPYFPTHIVATMGTFSQDDVGASLPLEVAVDGYASYVIASVIDSQTAVTADRTVSHSSFGPMGAGIGGAKISRAYNPTSSTVTFAEPLCEANDVGKILFWDDGTWDVITKYVNTSSVQILNLSNITHGTYQGVAWVAADRKYFDSNTDDALATRAGYLLPHRFFTPMPNCNLGKVYPGYVATAQTNNNKLYYCETNYPQLMGCYNEGLQYDEVEDNIVELSEFPNYIVAYGATHPGWMWAVNASQAVSDQTENSVGEAITVLPERTTLQGGFGVIPNSVAEDENGNNILLSTEKELMVFDGTKFGPNLLSERIMNRVSKLQNAMAARYDTFNGYIFEGTEDAVIS